MYVLAIGFRISMAATEEWPRVQAAHVHSFVAQVMEAAGTATEHAQNLAEVLTLADTRGHYSHGLNRLGEYMLFHCYVIIRCHNMMNIVVLFDTDT